MGVVYKIWMAHFAVAWANRNQDEDKDLDVETNDKIVTANLIFAAFLEAGFLIIK